MYIYTNSVRTQNNRIEASQIYGDYSVVSLRMDQVMHHCTLGMQATDANG